MVRSDKKVLLIAGPGRSGSTLLELILGNQDDYFSVGEVRYFWEYVSHGWGICGCGQTLDSCEYWKKIIFRISAGENCNINQLGILSKRINRTALIPFFLITPSSVRDKVEALSSAFDVLYNHIFQTTSKQVIVDSSKIGPYLHLLLNIPEIDLRVLHLVRDSRAVAYSWKYRQKTDPSRKERGGVMKERGLLRTSLSWLLTNYFIKKIGPKATAYSVMRYEDFVREPSSELERALRELGLPSLEIDLSGELDLEQTHSLGGNPIRFQSKKFTIQSKSVWKTNLNLFAKLGIGIVTFPVLKQFDYPLIKGDLP